MLFDDCKQSIEAYYDLDMYRNDLGGYYNILATTYNSEYYGHFFYKQITPDTDKGARVSSAYIFDVNTGKNYLIAKNRHNFSTSPVGKAPYASIDKENVLYSLSGDLLIQGTFLLNLTTGERKKITPYAVSYTHLTLPTKA